LGERLTDAEIEDWVPSRNFLPKLGHYDDTVSLIHNLSLDMIKILSKPTVKDLQLRGLENTKEFISQCLDWKMNIGEYLRSVDRYRGSIMETH